MLLLAFTSFRAAADHQDSARAALQADVPSALRLSTERLDRLAQSAGDPQGRVALGQLAGRLLLASGREEEAEELFGRQLKVYESLSRETVRWHGALDQGVLQLHLNRSGRALECFNAVADDRRAGVALRVEAMAGAAFAMHQNGDWRAGMQALDAARRLLDDAAAGQAPLASLLDCVALELSALQRKRASESLNDHGLCGMQRDGAADLSSNEVLCQQLGAAATHWAPCSPLVAHRMRFLAGLLAPGATPVMLAAHVKDALAWLRERRLAGLDVPVRIEGGLALIARGAAHAAAEVLNHLVYDEQQVQRSRHALQLQYCLSKIHQQQGRHVDALRLYRNHMQHVVHAIRHNPLAARIPGFLQEQASREAQPGDASRLRLPLRYRRAYQYMVEHLSDEGLSVRQVAAHVGVTERALQLAFRAHLGFTPAELIRKLRMDRIRGELQAQEGRQGVLEVASRWGITNRSTLAQNYRASFAETPTQTLGGGAAAETF